MHESYSMSGAFTFAYTSVPEKTTGSQRFHHSVTSIMQACHMSLSASADTTCLLCTQNHSTSLLVPQMQYPSCINLIPPGLDHGTSFLNWHMRATVHSRFRLCLDAKFKIPNFETSTCMDH